MIDRTHTLSITRQSELLGISRGSVYYVPRPVPESDLKLMRRIDELHLEHPFMGARQLRDTLNREGIEVGRRHVSTLMERMGVEPLYQRPNTSDCVAIFAKPEMGSNPISGAKIWRHSLPAAARARPASATASPVSPRHASPWLPH